MARFGILGAGFPTSNVFTSVLSKRKMSTHLVAIIIVFLVIKVETKEVESQPNVFDKMKKYLNAAKPQEAVMQKFFTSSLSPYCWLAECCNDDAIPGDINKLKSLLEKHVYGQHLVKTAVEAIESHWNSQHEPKKALVLSFHGWVGCGKNYVSNMIANSLFKLGTKSKHVHYFIGRVHFPLEHEKETYKENLYRWLKGNVSDCSKQLFIFDELDKTPESVLDDISPMMDYNAVVDGADYRKTIFIFISNIGGEDILTHYKELRNNGMERKDIEMKDFEELRHNGAFNEKGGLKLFGKTRDYLVDHYIPFLPMGQEHVIKCIRDEFRMRNVQTPAQRHIDEILDSLLWSTVKLDPDRSIFDDMFGWEFWTTERNERFSKTGCKSISTKVALLVTKFYKDASKSLVGKSDL